MNILLIHNAYQHRGGEEAVFESERKLLLTAGHRVTSYSIHNDQIHLDGIYGRMRLAARTVWSSDSYRAIASLLREEMPDIAHFHNTFPLVSPSGYAACREVGIPVVQTLHNYRLVCPGSQLFRDGRPCEECITSRVKWRGTVHGCYRNSTLATAVVMTMLAVHDRLGTWERNVARYVALSEFSRSKFIDGGLPPSKVVTKPNFVSPDPGIRETIEDFALSVGRLSPEKGTDLLLQAWSKVNRYLRLRLAGDGPSRGMLERTTENLGLSNVSFLGVLERDSVLSEIKRSRFLIVPSKCYENFPLAVAEAYACGVPVIAPGSGAVGEIVRNGVTGLHFESGNVEDLAAKIEWAWMRPSIMQAMGRAARSEFEAKYSAERNHEMLMKIYDQAISEAN